MTDNAAATLCEFEALHTARVRGKAAPSPAGLRAAAAGLLRESPRGLMLTSAGLERHKILAAEERATADLELVERTYTRFLAVNAPVKQACSAWQISGGGDEALFGVVGELTDYLDRVGPALTLAARELPRFDEHRVRLTAALEAATAGDASYVTDPSIPSFHTVWFECHEDYIVSLGRSREDEEA